MDTRGMRRDAERSWWGAGEHEEEGTQLKDMDCGPPPQEGTAGGQSYEGGGWSLSSQVPDTHWGSLLSPNSHL